ncbi:transporter [Streptomyces orinoci]|uniref:Transporter n=1 Tax=Streptomyces orinoci TaxID=67339 RepID=A0ABV3JXL7_STRON|nr:transporter [Streptomyces orinoci]
MSTTANASATKASGASLTPVFIRLKLSLLRNGLRQSSKRKAVWITSIVFTALYAALQLLGLIVLRGHPHVAALTVLLAVVLAVGWAFVPLFFPSGDETMDPTRLAMLPLRPGPLTVSLLAASLVGIGPAFTLVLAVGSVIATAHGGAAFAVGVPAVALTLLTCVALARAVATANVRLLSSRKGRDLALLSGLVIAVGIQVANYGLQKLSNAGGMARLEPFAKVLRWVPPGSAMDAVRSTGQGSYGLAAAQLALSAAVLALLLWWWQRGLTKVLTSPDSSTLAAAEPERKRVSTGLARLLPQGRTGAVMLRSLRYVLRDPKTRMTWTSQLVIGALVPFLNVARHNGNSYWAFMAVAMVGGQMYNLFGTDGSAFWLVMQTINGPRDAYLELRGRALAFALPAVPYLVLLVTALTAFTGHWDTLPEVLGLGLALLGAMFATGAVTSALLPYAVPQGNAFKNVGPGQTSIAWLGLLGGLLAASAQCVPLVLLTVWLHTSGHHGWLPLLLPLGFGYGLLAAWTGLRIAAPRLARRLPEVLAAVAKA